MAMRDKLIADTNENGTDNTTKLTDIKNRIEKVTTFAPPVVPSGIRTKQYDIAQSTKLGQDLTKSMQNFDINAPISEFDEDMESRVRNDKTRWNTKAQNLEDNARASQRTLTSGDNLLKQMNSPEFKSGPVDQYTSWLKNILPSELVDMSVEDIQAKASVNQFTAQVLKELSGLAASDSEAARTMLQTVGNPNMNEEVRRATLANYLTNTRSNLTKQAQQLADLGLNATAKRLLLSQGKGSTSTVPDTTDLDGVFKDNPIMQKGGSL